MEAADLAIVAGFGDTRRTLVGWNRAPARCWRRGRSPRPCIAVLLLLAVWGDRRASSSPTRRRSCCPGSTRPPTLGAVGHVLVRNSLVLALHSLACVAGYIAGSSLPREAETYSGLVRAIHDHAGPLAIAFVSGATLFSLTTQAYVLGSGASTLAAQGGIAPGLLLFGLLPHALPELVALFLPLAAWLRASRRGAWNELLAATVVTTGLAVPMLVSRRSSRSTSRPTSLLWLRALQLSWHRHREARGELLAWRDGPQPVARDQRVGRRGHRLEADDVVVVRARRRRRDG